MLSFLGRNVVSFSSKTQLGFLQNTIFFRSLSVASLRKKQSADSVSNYLICSCGLSPEHAKLLSSKINLVDFDKANAVVKLLEEYGLTNSEIPKIVVKWPQLLLARPNKTLAPKLQFLKSVGASSSDICMILSSNPKFLVMGLDTVIVPVYNTLRSVLVCNVKVFACMRRLGRVGKTFIRCLEYRLNYLQELGMPFRHISSLILNFPTILSAASHSFDQGLKKVVEIGCDPTKHSFVTAIKVMVSVNGEARKANLELYRKYGLSENEVWSIFKENPLVLRPSVERISGTMEFLVSKMGLQPIYVARNAIVFTYDLQNRIVPRFSVLETLRVKGLIEQEWSLLSVVITSEKKFLRLFVTKYPITLLIKANEINKVELTMLNLNVLFE